jgi:hypothetical protein
MAFTRLEADVENIVKLSDRPNQNDGLSAAQLKQWFDKSGVTLKDFINIVLLEELERTLDGESGADNIGATPVREGGPATLQGIVRDLQTQIADIEAKNIHSDGDETIEGVKTFTSSPIVPAPTRDGEAVNKKYVDDAVALKVNIDDIVNDLNTEGVKIPLSAAQGKKLGDAINELVTGKADKTPVIPAVFTLDWIGAEPPYTQEIPIEGITEYDTPVIAPVYSTIDLELALEQKAAWNCIDTIETDDGKIIGICFSEKPTVALPVQIKVV